MDLSRDKLSMDVCLVFGERAPNLSLTKETDCLALSFSFLEEENQLHFWRALCHLCLGALQPVE